MTTNAGANSVLFNISKSPGISRNLGPGQDRVNINHSPAVDQIRLTFTSAKSATAAPSTATPWPTRTAAWRSVSRPRTASGVLTGPVSRFDDEGITFTTGAMRPSTSATSSAASPRGDYFDVVILGTSAADTFDETGSTEEYYINGGMGNDSSPAGQPRLPGRRRGRRRARRPGRQRQLHRRRRQRSRSPAATATTWRSVQRRDSTAATASISAAATTSCRLPRPPAARSA